MREKPKSHASKLKYRAERDQPAYRNIPKRKRTSARRGPGLGTLVRFAHSSTPSAHRLEDSAMRSAPNGLPRFRSVVQTRARRSRAKWPLPTAATCHAPCYLPPAETKAVLCVRSSRCSSHARLPPRVAGPLRASHNSALLFQRHPGAR